MQFGIDLLIGPFDAPDALRPALFHYYPTPARVCLCSLELRPTEKENGTKRENTMSYILISQSDALIVGPTRSIIVYEPGTWLPAEGQADLDYYPYDEAGNKQRSLDKKAFYCFKKDDALLLAVAATSQWSMKVQGKNQSDVTNGKLQLRQRRSALFHLIILLHSLFSTLSQQSPPKMALEQVATSTKTVHSLDECKKHMSEKSCWLAIHGKVYDVTEFLDEHPGATHLLLEPIAFELS